MKKAYLLLLAGMLSTVTYADNNQTVKIEGSIIDKVVTEITFDGDEVVLHYSDNSSDTKNMSLVANGHQQPLPALANILDSYESGVVKVMGVE